MHVIAIGVFVLVSSAIYHRFKTRKWGLISLIIGGICMTAAMLPANIIITPIFMGVPVEAVYGMIVPILLPFNLLKMAINTVAVFLLYKRLSPFLHKW
jgi:riboflavin transporter FmnP